MIKKFYFKESTGSVNRLIMALEDRIEELELDNECYNNFDESVVKENQVIYKDTYCIMGTDPEELWSYDDFLTYWNNNLNDDPILDEYEDFDSWYNDCILNMEEVEDLSECNEAVKREIEESDFISDKEKEIIMDVFDMWDVVVIKHYMEDEMYEGNLYHNFVVETDEMSYTTLEEIERELRKLEDKYDIGYERNFNDNGENARTYYFYKFIN